MALYLHQRVVGDYLFNFKNIFVFAIFSMGFFHSLGLANNCQEALGHVLGPQKQWYLDDYWPAEERERFIEVHDRFGVFREGDRLKLVARDEDTARKLIAELQTSDSPIYKGVIKGFPYKNDITDLVNPLAREYAQRFAFDSPNCFNLCLVSKGIAKGIHQTTGLEFSFWLNSPLAEEIPSYSELMPGDIIVFRRVVNGKTAEVHGAVFYSPHIVLTKNGDDETRPYRLMDISEVYNIYSRFSNHVQFFRLRSLEEYLSNNPSPFNAQIITLFEASAVIERKWGSYSMQDRPDLETPAYQTSWREFNQSKSTSIGQLIEEIEVEKTKIEKSSAPGPERNKAIGFLDALIIRLKNLRYRRV